MEPWTIRGINGRPTRPAWIVNSETGCWDWDGATNGAYGHSDPRHGDCLAHRAVYKKVVGDIPDGKVIDHVCRNKLCVNPAHMEVVTQKENVHRWLDVFIGRSIRTHCVHGHEFTPENTMTVTRKGRKARRCLECHRRYSREGARRARARQMEVAA